MKLPGHVLLLLKKHSASGSSFLLSSKDQESLNLLDATIRCLNFCCATFELLLCHQDTLNHNLPTARLRLQGRFAESFLLLLADANKAHTDTHQALQRAHCLKNLVHFSICACHPCAGAMLIFSVSFQFYRMIPEGNPASGASAMCMLFRHMRQSCTFRR